MLRGNSGNLSGQPQSISSQPSISDLYRATPESAGLDLCATTYTVLTPEMGMQALPTGIYGPLPYGSVELLLGRSSTTMKGLLIAPGIIDSDFEGEIKVMAHSPRTITAIPAGQRIAQLILLPTIATGKTKTERKRGTAGFGSSDVYWIQQISDQRPELTLEIQGRKFKGILDTGADISVIAASQWPENWPKQVALSMLQGIGQSHNPEQSSAFLSWKDEEGLSGIFQPYILPNLPVNLWGRDIMSNMGVFLYSPKSTITQQLLSQGPYPNQGLGKHNQGITQPLQVKGKRDRKGLGHF
ncbi:LOW QUALITY PROTEIN: endogenous retrovirus group K member 7 Pro protein-like [Vicugna pacos]|uniref:human endogenous retrovirus K endopeptidase n=1 Tax=Vicugna pacos TaxID=30538 RepID=A0ABM5DBI0_VICPA